MPLAGSLAAGKKKTRPELADIFRRYGERFEQTHRVSLAEHKVIRAVTVCRTEELGGHLYRCDACDFERPVYNSCRNRHCPKCQSLAKAQWLEKQTSELLPVGYFHLVFTLPHEFNRLILAHKKILLALLFKAVSETLLSLAKGALAQRWGSSPCFILGIKLSRIIFICIVWSPPAPCLWITAVGLEHGQTFCFPSPLCPRFSGKVSRSVRAGL